jgi:sugar phosphate isomerase/epimerase
MIIAVSSGGHPAASAHPRVSLHQVVFADQATPAFIDLCRASGVRHMTLASVLMRAPGDLDAVRASMADGGPRLSTLNHPFGTFPDLEKDSGEAARGLAAAIDTAASLGARGIYMQTGGRGALDWEQAAAKFTALLAPARDAARAQGVSLSIENASPFNIDIHIAHTLADTIHLAEMAGIDVCIDLQPCWGEAGLPQLFRRAMPITNLVQVSDYVIGDRVAPCRAVPGDGAVPLERLIGDLLEAGYTGLFDIELVGPRIRQEGSAAAAVRSIHRLSELLVRLGA